ncbi:MAG: hypothetical protein JWR32_2423 [Mycobacterium sp.]|jgi:hypothetical protein|nr:hypothetical protein [Mycobacterium sp.]
MTGRRGLRLAAAAMFAICVAVAATLIMRHESAPTPGDCAVAADMVSRWRTMTEAIATSLDGPSDTEILLATANTEAATADQLRTRADDIASSHLRSVAMGLPDALDMIARSRRSAADAIRHPGVGPDRDYVKGSDAAGSTVAALRSACPSIPAAQRPR